jgi:hypothetical protein
MKRRMRSGAIIIVFSLIPLMNLIDSPRWSEIRALTFVQIYASGLCVGVGFAMLMLTLRDRRRDSNGA